MVIQPLAFVATRPVLDAITAAGIGVLAVLMAGVVVRAASALREGQSVVHRRGAGPVADSRGGAGPVG